MAPEIHLQPRNPSLSTPYSVSGTCVTAHVGSAEETRERDANRIAGHSLSAVVSAPPITLNTPTAKSPNTCAVGAHNAGGEFVHEPRQCDAQPKVQTSTASRGSHSVAANPRSPVSGTRTISAVSFGIHLGVQPCEEAYPAARIRQCGTLKQGTADGSRTPLIAEATGRRAAVNRPPVRSPAFPFGAGKGVEL